MRSRDGRRHVSGVALMSDEFIRREIDRYGGFELDDSGYPIMHTTHKDAELLGVKKLDILSSKMLENLDATIADVNHKHSGSIVVRDLEIAIHSQAALDLIVSGNTEGVFHMASSAAQKICTELKPQSFEDVVNIMALNRPGTRDQLDILTGKTQSGIVDPKGVFASTNGAVIYQEQIMEAAQVYFGIKPEQSDQFRRELSKDVSEREVAHKENAINNASGLDKSQATKLYSQLEKFAEFGFNKSHAVAYSKHVMHTAYLKAHYPHEFANHFLDGTRNNDIREEIEYHLYGAQDKAEQYRYAVRKEVMGSKHQDRAMAYMFEFKEAGKFSGDIAMDRAEFDASNIQAVQNATSYDMKDRDDYTTRPYENINNMLAAERVVKIYNKHDTIKEATNEYMQRDEKIKQELGHNKQVQDFAKVYPDAAKYFAAQIVDLNMQSGIVPTPRRLEMMKNIATQQSLLEKQLTKQFDLNDKLANTANEISNKDKILTTEIASKDKVAAIELATSRLCTSMTHEMHISRVTELDVAKAQSMRNEELGKTQTQIKEMQQSYTQERGQEISRQNQKDRGIDM